MISLCGVEACVCFVGHRHGLGSGTGTGFGVSTGTGTGFGAYTGMDSGRERERVLKCVRARVRFGNGNGNGNGFGVCMSSGRERTRFGCPKESSNTNTPYVELGSGTDSSVRRRALTHIFSYSLSRTHHTFVISACVCLYSRPTPFCL